MKANQTAAQRVTEIADELIDLAIQILAAAEASKAKAATANKAEVNWCHVGDAAEALTLMKRAAYQLGIAGMSAD